MSIDLEDVAGSSRDASLAIGDFLFAETDTTQCPREKKGGKWARLNYVLSGPPKLIEPGPLFPPLWTSR